MSVEVHACIGSNSSSRRSHPMHRPLLAETSFCTTRPTDASARWNIILAIRCVNLVRWSAPLGHDVPTLKVLLGISNALIVTVTIQIYRDSAQIQYPQKDCMLSASAVAAHADIDNVQMFTASLSTLVLLTTITALLAATYRSPQPEHLVGLHLHFCRTFKFATFPASLPLQSLCYSIACTPFCLFVYGLHKSKDGCTFFERNVPHDSAKFSGSGICATIQNAYCMDIKMPVASVCQASLVFEMMRRTVRYSVPYRMSCLRHGSTVRRWVSVWYGAVTRPISCRAVP